MDYFLFEHPLLLTLVVLITGLLLDQLLGETSKFHPLVGFGNLASSFENYFNQQELRPQELKVLGTLCWIILVIPVPMLCYLINLEQYMSQYLTVIVDICVVYFAVGLKSLKQHAINIYRPLKNNDMPLARHATSMMVSRQTNQLTSNEMSRAAVESTLENGHDAVIATLFYYVIGGAPLVLFHRLVNTLDAMWGYKNDRFLHFGYCAAKLDDLMGWPSAKITALCYALTSPLKWRTIIKAIRHATSQSQRYKSLNGGWAMAAGATMLGVTLGGSANYHGKSVYSATLGAGRQVTISDIKASTKLVNKAVGVFLLALVILQVALLF